MGTTGTTPGNRGRFRGFDVLGLASGWDAATRDVVLSRLAPPPAPSFSTPEEEAVARPLLDRLLAQDEEPRVPVFETIDARLARGQGDGWRHEELPEDGEAWRRILSAVQRRAVEDHGAGFAELDRRDQEA